MNMDSEYHFAELLQVSTMTLATISAAGTPHAAPIYFAASKTLELFFFSDPTSQHGRDLEANPLAAAALYPESESWQTIRGLQMRGQAHILDRGPEWEVAWEIYQRKFPFVSGLKSIVARNAMYIFKPEWIRLVDNRRGFGFKQEWGLK
jgi:hypothetical protein